jgi:hypothetical protein
VTQLFDATIQVQRNTLPVSIARSLNQLNLARSQSLYAAPDLSTAAAIEFQIELRNAMLFHLGNIRSALARQLFCGMPRNRLLSEMTRRRSGKTPSARPVRG